MHSTSCVEYAAPVSPGGITTQQLSLYPLRIAQCLALILAHEQEICAYTTGNLELHWHGASVVGTCASRWMT